MEIIQSKAFAAWLHKLRDPVARSRIAMRLRSLPLGNMGDVAPIGAGLSELRIHYGPGYRVYLMQRGRQLIVLLCGGDKSTQRQDIERAHQIAEQWKE